MKARYTLRCGCVVILEHDKGDRRDLCPGGGMTPKNGSVARDALVLCPGGRQWKVTAEPVAQVRYHDSEIKKASA